MTSIKDQILAEIDQDLSVLSFGKPLASSDIEKGHYRGAMNVLEHLKEFIASLPDDDATPEFLFPQLKESEDERTRKAIINYILYKADGVSEEDEHRWVSWLEKQKEKDRIIPERELTDFEIEVHEIIAQARCDKRLADEAVLKQFEQEAACALMLKAEKQKEQNLLPGFEMTGEEIMEHPLFLEGFDVGRDVGHIEAEQKRVILDNPLTGEACYEVEIREYMKGADPDEMAAVLLLTKKGWTVIAPGHEQKPAEWSEDWREEDIQTRFAFYTYKDEDGVLYLSNVFVEETSRNHGFGTKILIAAEKVAETIGATTISLKVKQDSPANAWYRKNGYGYVAFEDGYDWLEKNLEYMKPNKQEWSEKDEEMYINVASSLRGYACGLENEEHKKHIQKELDWLENRFKSLRPQPKVELTELDKNILEAAMKAYPINSTSKKNRAVQVGRIIAFRNGYKLAENDLGWHSVEESLPERKGWYFTCINDNGTPQALGVTYFDGKEWTDDDSTENIDYWMPCPKLPEE